MCACYQGRGLAGRVGIDLLACHAVLAICLELFSLGVLRRSACWWLKLGQKLVVLGVWWPGVWCWGFELGAHGVQGARGLLWHCCHRRQAL